MKTRNLILIALVVLLIAAFAYMVAPQEVKMKAIAKDIVRDHARFTPIESVDIAMAMKLVTHDPPKMLNPPSDVPPLLLYPPSETDLARLSGP